MNIINFYYDKTCKTISQIELLAKDFDYMNWLVLESVKSIYLLSNDLVSDDKKGMYSCLKRIIKNNNVTSVNNSTLYSFVESAKQEFKVFSDGRSDALTILDKISAQLKDVFSVTKINENDVHYWDTPKYHNNILDSSCAKELLISLYLFIILLFFFCVQLNGELFSALTTDFTKMDNQDGKIRILDEFYQKGSNQIIQFFLPIEADVTLSYFLYRYVFNEKICGKLGNQWAMGNTEEKVVPSKIIDIIHIIEPFRKNNSEKGIKNETFHSWINTLKEYGIFNTAEIDSVEKIKVLCLRQYVLSAKWYGNDRTKQKLDLIDFIKKPKKDFWGEFGTHIKTEAKTAGTVLASEMMKELPINDVCVWVEKYLGVELGIKNIQHTLKILCTNNSYLAPHREEFIYELEYCYKNFKIKIDDETTNIFSKYSPILVVFLIYNLYKAKACLQNAYTQFTFLNEHFSDLILSVYPKWDDNPQEQEQMEMIDDLTGDKLSEFLANIDISLTSQLEKRRELNRLCTFFRLYFPEKYLVEQKCTRRELVSVYELLNDVKQSSLPPKIIKAFSATQEAHDEAGIVRELALAKIEMHHMASNYSNIFIPVVLRVLDLFEYPNITEANIDIDKMSFYSNTLYELCNCSKHINIWVEQLCRYLFGRNIDGKYYSDFFPDGKRIDVNPEAEVIFNDFFIPWENSVIEGLCAYWGISREELSNIWYSDLKKKENK